MLRLVAEVLRDPVFPATEFEQARQQSIQGLENQRQQPGAVASVAMSVTSIPIRPVTRATCLRSTSAWPRCARSRSTR